MRRKKKQLEVNNLVVELKKKACDRQTAELI